jgi:HEPN domain-containing protein
MINCKVKNTAMQVYRQYNIQEFDTSIFMDEGPDADELNYWKEKLTSILQQVPPRADILKPLIQFLVTTIVPAKIYMMKPEYIIDTDEENNIDLLIVIPGRSGIAFIELEPILNIAFLQHGKVNCSLHNEGNVLEGLRNGHIFYSIHCTSDNLIYDDKQLVYPTTSQATLTIMKQQALKSFDWYFQKAQDFYNSAVALNQNHFSPIVMFMLNQAAELIYRGILQNLNGYDKRTHEIRVLMKHARRCAGKLNTVFKDDTEEGRRIIQLLNNAYLDARYASQYNIDDKDLVLIFEKVKHLHLVAKEIIVNKLGGAN